MQNQFFNRAGVAGVIAFFSGSFAGPLAYAAPSKAQAAVQQEDPVYQLKGDPEDELKRVQQENAAMNLDDQTNVEETDQVISTEQRVGNQTGELRRYFQKGLELQVGYSFFAPYATGSGSAGTNVSFTPSGSPSLGIRYSSIRNDGFGYDIGLHFDPSYGASSIAVNNQPATNVIPVSGSFMAFVPELNATFEVEGAYVFAGANYILPIASVGSAGMSGSIGGQIGIGYFLGSSISNLDFGSNALSLELMFQAYELSFNNLSGNLGANGSATPSSQPIAMGGGMIRFGLNFR